MKTTRNRKVKRGKTRRTRRKTRTVHRGGGWPWSKKNEDASEPTITLEQVKKYLSDKSLNTTLDCLTKDVQRKTIYLCDAPCNSAQPPVTAAPSQASLQALSTDLPITPPNGWTEKNPNPNGWYTKVERDMNLGNITSIQNANLKNMSGGPGNINGFGSDNFQKYMDGINELPNPLYSYSTNIDDTQHTFTLKSNDGGSYLLWNDNELYRKVRINDTISYNPENPLTITIKGNEYTLTKVE